MMEWFTLGGGGGGGGGWAVELRSTSKGILRFERGEGSRWMLFVFFF